MLAVDRDRLIATLDAVAAHWRTAGPAPVTALMVSTGLPERLVRIALENAFSALTAQNLLLALLSSGSDPTEQRSASSGFDPNGAFICSAGSDPARKTYIVCPGNVFTAWLPSAVLSLLLGHSVYLKPSIHEPVFPRLWRESLIQADAAMASRVHLWVWNPGDVASGDQVIVYGSDETLARLRVQVPHSDFVGHGHQTSAAVVFPEAMSPEEWPKTREAARAAIEPFQLRGCLSPQMIWVPEESLRPWRDFSQTIHPFPDIRAYASLDEIRSGLNAWPGRLALVGYAGRDDRSKSLQTLVPAGTRVCPIQSMQRPSLVTFTVGNP